MLPAPSQFEKWEATFFNLEFPQNVFQLRAPLLEPLPGTLPEPEIHRRLVRALGALTDDDLAPLRAAAAQGRAAFADAFFDGDGGEPDARPAGPGGALRDARPDARRRHAAAAAAVGHRPHLRA